jgi:rod shape-determining protein MreC
VKFYTNFSTLGVVAVVVSDEGADPRDALVPPKPIPTPIPTVTVFVTPSPSPTN